MRLVKARHEGGLLEMQGRDEYKRAALRWVTGDISDRRRAAAVMGRTLFETPTRCFRWSFLFAALGACGEGNSHVEPAYGTGNPSTTTGSSSAAQCNTVVLYPDADGDGVYAGPSGDRVGGMAVCANDEPPPGFGSGDDCDDADPAVWQKRCLDQDGDGLRNPIPICAGDATDENVPCGGIFGGPHDCDDSDPELLDYYYIDEDGDGWGAGDPVCFRPEAGWSRGGSDCDDRDPKRAPSALEYPGDSIDSDCNGNDGPRCLPGDFEDFVWPAEPVESPSDCGGPDLALGLLSCSICLDYNSTFALANTGQTAVNAEVGLWSDESGNVASASVSLAPGEQRILVSGPFLGRFVLMFTAEDMIDCNPGNNEAYAGGGLCE